MARMMTTNQKKNTMMPGIAYPPTVLALATAASYPTRPDLFHGGALEPPGPSCRRGHASQVDADRSLTDPEL
jgi:hypothetical protein